MNTLLDQVVQFAVGLTGGHAAVAVHLAAPGEVVTHADGQAESTAGGRWPETASGRGPLLRPEGSGQGSGQPVCTGAGLQGGAELPAVRWPEQPMPGQWRPGVAS